MPQHRTQNATSKRPNSEDDWGWVLRELANGKDPKKLTRSLASRRADNPRPLFYAQRTVDLASARLWLIQGIQMDHIVTMLVAPAAQRDSGRTLHRSHTRLRKPHSG
jgi:hypothetical protein